MKELVKALKKTIKAIIQYHSLLRLKRIMYQIKFYLISNKKYYRKIYKKEFEYEPRFESPCNLSELLISYNIYGHFDDYNMFTDKYTVREYVRSTIGNDHLNTLYGVYEDVNDIDFSSLPNEFVMKASHSSGQVLIVNNKSGLDFKKTKKILTEWLKTDFYKASRERCYRNIKPRIMIEKLLSDGSGKVPRDYKIFCFNGEPKFIQVFHGRLENLGKRIYDLNWNPTPFDVNVRPSQSKTTFDFPRPSNLNEMIDIARKLSAPLIFSRVDLYSIDDKTIFGEITLLPHKGIVKIRPKKYEDYYKQMIS